VSSFILVGTSSSLLEERIMLDCTVYLTMLVWYYAAFSLCVRCSALLLRCLAIQFLIVLGNNISSFLLNLKFSKMELYKR
jgi:hypothetical protein